MMMIIIIIIIIIMIINFIYIASISLLSNGPAKKKAEKQ